MRIIHLDSGPRDSTPLCGADSTDVTTDINDVTCESCEAKHDDIIEKGKRGMKVTPDTLNSVMEFDHVIVVHEDGTVTDAPNGIYEPNLWDGELDDSRWTLMDGYSGQYSYSGPVMHSSEFIGGGMARDILATPGMYVAIVANYSGEDGEEDTAEGWAVARLTD